MSSPPRTTHPVMETRARQPAPFAPLRHLGVVGLFFALTLMLTWPLPRQLGQAIPGDAFDGWQNYWNLWWVRTALLELGVHPYFTPLLYHPSGVSLWFQTMNIFNGLASMPLQLAGNLFWAYNGVVLFSFTIAGYGAYLLTVFALRRGGAKPGRPLWLAGILAGIIYTFSPFHFAHLLGHMQVFSLEFIPFYALYALRALPDDGARIRRRDALMAGFFLILTGLCDWYFVLYLAFFTLFYLLWLLWRRRLSVAHLKNVALIALLFLAVTWPLLAPMVLESMRYDFMRPPAGQIVQLSADVLGFLLPSGQHPIWGEWAARARAALPASPSENTLFLGVVPLLLAIYGLRRARRALAFWALTALLFAIFALGPVLHVGGRIIMLPNGQPFPLPYALLLRLPFIDIARTVARYDLMVMLSLGVLAAGGLHQLATRPRGNSLALLLIAVTLFEFSPIPYPISPPDTPAWYQTLAADPRRAAVMNLPMDWDRPGYLLYQTVHGKPLTAGYISRNDPRTYPPRIPILTDFRHNAPDINSVDPARYAATIFEFMDIGWVVADRYKMPPGPTREWNEALLRAIFASRAPAYEDERLTVYETWPPQTRLPFIELGYDWGPLEPGPTRRVRDSATIIIHSPEAGVRTLKIIAARPDATFRLIDATGREVAKNSADSLEASLFLQPGPNRFTL
ncbi:MAG: hypothetical protein GXP42_01700, partial [Chloroflexi bacterium]|nr:hypothetical protein [Chloroflexota bacterium]